MTILRQKNDLWKQTFLKFLNEVGDFHFQSHYATNCVIDVIDKSLQELSKRGVKICFTSSVASSIDGKTYLAKPRSIPTFNYDEIQLANIWESLITDKNKEFLIFYLPLIWTQYLPLSIGNDLLSFSTVYAIGEFN